jgi:hypothetical protein
MPAKRKCGNGTKETEQNDKRAYKTARQKEDDIMEQDAAFAARQAARIKKQNKVSAALAVIKAADIAMLEAAKVARQEAKAERLALAIARQAKRDAAKAKREAAKVERDAAKAEKETARLNAAADAALGTANLHTKWVPASEHVVLNLSTGILPQGDVSQLRRVLYTVMGYFNRDTTAVMRVGCMRNNYIMIRYTDYDRLQKMLYDSYALP